MNDVEKFKPKILLAEDDGAMRRFLEITLQNAGYAVVSANDGLAAMQIALSEEIFDAVVTDALMPNLSGHDLCRILRGSEKFRRVPLIILSGLEREIAANSEHDCAEIYLVKGAQLKDELIEKLPELLAAKK
ncbi:MAG: response regulator [Acidobacteriota bacterium]|nr:response regulator [Acidobacteriota bacterium]